MKPWAPPLVHNPKAAELNDNSALPAQSDRPRGIAECARPAEGTGGKRAACQRRAGTGCTFLSPA